MSHYRQKENKAYEGTVAFADAKEIQKKQVRGLLKKRAKQYDSDSGSGSEDDGKAGKAKRVRNKPSSF